MTFCTSCLRPEGLVVLSRQIKMTLSSMIKDEVLLEQFRFTFPVTSTNLQMKCMHTCTKPLLHYIKQTYKLVSIYVHILYAIYYTNAKPHSRCK